MYCQQFLWFGVNVVILGTRGRCIMKWKYKLRGLLNRYFVGAQLKLYKVFRLQASDSFMGKKIFYDPNSDVGKSLFFSGAFEDQEVKLLQKYIDDESVVLDVGANIGLHSLFFSNLAKNGLVIAFEPSVSTFENLLKNVRTRGNILPLNIAAFDKNELKKFYITDDNAYSSLKDTGRKAILKIDNILCVKIDDILLSSGLGRIDFVKIDVEGFEKNVLLGMVNIIMRYKPVIFCEIYKGENSNDDPEGTIELLLGKGYDAFVLKDGKSVPYEKHDDTFYNYLFVPKALT